MRPLLPLVAAVTALGCTGISVPAQNQARSSAQPRELLPEQQIHQALNRLGFGPRPGDFERVRRMGVDRWIASQLQPERIEDGAAERLLASYPSLSWSTGDIVQRFQAVQRARREIQRDRAAMGDTLERSEARREIREDPELMRMVQQTQRVGGDLQSARLARAVASERQLQEVMVDFWENHFSVFAGKGQTRNFLTAYDRDVIRPRALGRFRDLLGAVAHSPAMLFYLDNWQSASDSTHRTLGELQRGRTRRPRAALPQPPQRRPRGLNENYARELMELHTLGVDGGYTQQDVVNVARALTGWSINLREGSFVFRRELHDADAKVVLGHTLPGGRGVEDGEQVLDILVRHPSTARYIAKKLVIRFVSDSAPPALVERAAATFRRTDGDIREVVRTIVTSPEFFSRSAYRAKVKSPFELVASALRVMGARPDTTPRTAQIVARLGQPIFGRQTPDGWPERGDAWMNTGAILNRINFGIVLAAGRVPGASLRDWPGTAALQGQRREAQADGVIRLILGGEASPDTRAILIAGENPLLRKYGSDSAVVRLDDDSLTAMERPMREREPGRIPRRAAGGRALDRPVQLDGLAQMVGLALGAPEFQRR